MIRCVLLNHLFFVLSWFLSVFEELGILLFLNVGAWGDGGREINKIHLLNCLPSKILLHQNSWVSVKLKSHHPHSNTPAPCCKCNDPAWDWTGDPKHDTNRLAQPVSALYQLSHEHIHKNGWLQPRGYHTGLTGHLRVPSQFATHFSFLLRLVPSLNHRSCYRTVCRRNLQM